MADDGAGGDFFGLAVSLEHNLALVGANFYDDRGNASGGAYLFVPGANGWEQWSKLVPSDAAEGDEFGWSVAVDADAAFLGARGGDDMGEDSGAVHVFEGIAPRMLSLPAAQGIRGSTVSVPIELNVPANFIGAAIRVSYDPTRLSVETGGVGTSTLTDGFVMNAIVEEEGELAIAMAGSAALSHRSAGALVHIPFTVDAGVVIGEKIDLSFTQASLVFDDGELVTMVPETVAGSLEIIDVSPGDIDRDGVLGIADVVLILRAVVEGGEGLAPLPRTLADADQDGSITVADAFAVFRTVLTAKPSLRLVPVEPIAVRWESVPTAEQESTAIRIKAEPADQVFAVELHLRYDAETAELEEIVRGTTAGLLFSSAPGNGLVCLAGVSRGGLETPEGYLAELRFSRSSLGPPVLSLEQVLLLGSEGDELPARVLQSEESVLPRAFRLYPNFPNPFNPQTTIRYDLPEPTRVRITLYNSLGQQLENLERGVQPAGQHSLVFDAGAHGSGVYLLVVRAGDVEHTTRMLLLK